MKKSPSERRQQTPETGSETHESDLAPSDKEAPTPKERSTSHESLLFPIIRSTPFTSPSPLSTARGGASLYSQRSAIPSGSRGWAAPSPHLPGWSPQPSPWLQKKPPTGPMPPSKEPLKGS